jgi:NADPH-dependent ferric siderophore reductase
MPVVRQTAAESAAATGRRRASFHTLTVDEVRRLTDDAIEVTFGVPAELAGQFDYLPGQYVALRTTLPDENGEATRSAPNRAASRTAAARSASPSRRTWVGCSPPGPMPSSRQAMPWTS